MDEMTPEKAKELLRFTSPAPWDVDDCSSTVRGDDACAVCRFDFEDEAGQRIYPVSWEQDRDLVAAAPDLARAYLAQAEETARLREALAGLMQATTPALQRSYPKSEWANAWEIAQALLKGREPRGLIPQEDQ